MTNEEAIKILSCRDNNGVPISWQNGFSEAYDMAIEALKLASNLHQTCVTDAKGHWIIFPPFIEEICMCSNCKTKFKEAYQHRDTCPSCGAKMEV